MNPEPARSRVSWGAVIAGVAVALVTLLLIDLLALWIGLATFDPIADPRPFEGIGTGAAIVAAIGMAIALFVGGIVTGRLANRIDRSDVMLHGILTWAVTIFVGLWLTATVIGTLLTGALGVVGTGLGAVGEGAAAVAPDVVERVEGVLAEQQEELDEAMAELEPLWTDPAARAEFRAAVRRIVRDGGPVTEAQRDQLVTIVADNTELSEAQAADRVDSWIAAYERTRAELAQLEQDLRVAGDRVADALSRAAMWAFLGLVVGGFVTVAGARVGAPVTTADRRRP